MVIRNIILLTNFLSILEKQIKFVVFYVSMCLCIRNTKK